MIWHIMKKDWKLSWLMITGIAAVRWLVAAIEFKASFSSLDRSLHLLQRDVLNPLLFIGSALLIAMIIQQDPIPGVRQDWLVRPIQRWHLLLEKTLLVMVAVEGPILVSDVFEVLANGFPLRQAIAAALSHALFLLLSFTLPTLAFTSLTRNLSEAIVWYVIAAFGYFIVLDTLLSLTLGAFHTFQSLGQPTLGSGVEWVGESLRLAFALLGAIAILVLQYFRRKTRLSRCLTVAFLILMGSTSFLPWKPAFAMQQRLSPNPGSGASTVLAFNSEESLSPPSVWGSVNEGKAEVRVPLLVAGLPSDTILLADRSEVCLIAASGKTEYCGTGESMSAYTKEGNLHETRPVQRIVVPTDAYLRIKGQSVRLEIIYSLTQWRLDRSDVISAVGGDQQIPGLGRCKTKINKDDTAVELSCMQPGQRPFCATGFLENAATERRNFAYYFACEPNHSPFINLWSFYSAMTHFSVQAPFSREPGMLSSPVDRSQLSESRIVNKLYRPTDYFTRRLVIPQITFK